MSISLCKLVCAPSPPSDCQFSVMARLQWSGGAVVRLYVADDTNAEVCYYGNPTTSHMTRVTGLVSVELEWTTVAYFTGTTDFRIWYNQPTTDDPEVTTFDPVGSYVGVTNAGASAILVNGVLFPPMGGYVPPTPYTFHGMVGGMVLVFYASEIPSAGYGTGDQSTYTGGADLHVECVQVCPYCQAEAGTAACLVITGVPAGTGVTETITVRMIRVAYADGWVWDWRYPIVGTVSGVLCFDPSWAIAVFCSTAYGYPGVPNYNFIFGYPGGGAATYAYTSWSTSHTDTEPCAVHFDGGMTLTSGHGPFDPPGVDVIDMPDMAATLTQIDGADTCPGAAYPDDCDTPPPADPPPYTDPRPCPCDDRFCLILHIPLPDDPTACVLDGGPGCTDAAGDHVITRISPCQWAESSRRECGAGNGNWVMDFADPYYEISHIFLGDSASVAVQGPYYRIHKDDICPGGGTAVLVSTGDLPASCCPASIVIDPCGFTL